MEDIGYVFPAIKNTLSIEIKCRFLNRGKSWHTVFFKDVISSCRMFREYLLELM